MQISERELLREQWRIVANRLGLRFVAPISLPLPDGTHCKFAALLPQFGGELGMLIDTEHSVAASEAATAAGYGMSSMLVEHRHLPIDAANYIDCLVDWGWVGQGAAPTWYAGAA